MAPPDPSTLRSLGRDGSFNVERRGARTTDVYHHLVVTSWPRFLALTAAGYLVANALFALLYLAGAECIAGALPGSFIDAFFFSVQTMATIGYGTMAPATTYAHVLVTVEALFGLLGVAMASGLMFAKFSRPTARVVFSNVAVVNTRDGTPHLVFRVANLRENQIVEASMTVTALLTETSSEGETMRRFYELKLSRSRNPAMALSWTVMHPIDDQSPFHHQTVEALRAQGIELLASLVGLDGTFSQTIHARHSYTTDEIVWNARFVDIISVQPDGKRRIDLTHMHEFEPTTAFSTVGQTAETA